jgi:ABC-2 type transport system ATP-binding protein
MGQLSALRVERLRKSYRGRPALNGLDPALEPAHILALLGPNGSGKSTTVGICEGLLRPDNGSARVLGVDPTTQGQRLRARIGAMPQGGGAYPGVRAGEMLRLVASCSAHPHPVDWLLETLGLSGVQRVPYNRLSGGLRQRLALACAVVGRPELVLLDEPTAGMDPQGRRLVWELIGALRREGVSVVLTTHLIPGARHDGSGRDGHRHRLVRSTRCPRRGATSRSPEPGGRLLGPHRTGAAAMTPTGGADAVVHFHPGALLPPPAAVGSGEW